MNLFLLEQKFTNLKDQKLVQLMREKCAPSSFYKHVWSKQIVLQAKLVRLQFSDDGKDSFVVFDRS